MNPLSDDWSSIQKIRPHRYKCGYCNALVSPDKGYPGVGGLICICSGCNRPSYFETNPAPGVPKQIPGIPFGEPVRNLPDLVAKLYEEARIASAAGAHTAAVLATRKLLMHIAVDQKAPTNKSFIEYVEYLAKNGFVPPNGQTWVDHIRKKGNEANHEIILMTDSDSRDLITFVEMLLKFIYEFPSRVPRAAAP